MRFIIRALAVLGVLASATPSFAQMQRPAQQAPAYFPPDVSGAVPPPVQYPGQPAPYALPPVEPVRIPEHLSNDPLLDRPFSPQPGFYFVSEAAVYGVHLTNQLSGQVTTPGGRVDSVTPPGSPLDATVSPRFEVGYRIPNGFGSVGLGFRWLTTSGSGNVIGDSGPATQHGRFNFNVLDLDYHTRSFSLGPVPGDDWDFRWTFGFRAINLYFDNRLNYTGAVGPEAVTTQRETNGLNAFGVHVALDLYRKLDDYVPGLAFGGRVGWTDLFGRVRQRFSEDIAGTPGATSSFGRFETSPLAFRGKVGLNYSPPGWNHSSIFLGYQTEYWWGIGRLSQQLTGIPNVGAAVNSRATLELQGFVIQAGFNF